MAYDDRLISNVGPTLGTTCRLTFDRVGVQPPLHEEEVCLLLDNFVYECEGVTVSHRCCVLASRVDLAEQGATATTLSVGLSKKCMSPFALGQVDVLATRLAGVRGAFLASGAVVLGPLSTHKGRLPGSPSGLRWVT